MPSDLSALETFLRSRLTRPLPGPDAQRRFAPRPAVKNWEPDMMPPEARLAAALILIYEHEGHLHLPLTLRRDDLPHHPGQISLPGGAVDSGESEEQAALREAHEEIGINPESVQPLGALSTLWVVVSGYLVRPFIATTPRRPAFRPAEREVAAIVEARLDDVLDAGRLRWFEVRRGGIVFHYPYFDLEGHRVWGATAMILGEFASLWHDHHSPPPLPGQRAGG